MTKVHTFVKLIKEKITKSDSISNNCFRLAINLAYAREIEIQNPEFSR